MQRVSISIVAALFGVGILYGCGGGDGGGAGGGGAGGAGGGTGGSTGGTGGVDSGTGGIGRSTGGTGGSTGGTGGVDSGIGGTGGSTGGAGGSFGVVTPECMNIMIGENGAECFCQWYEFDCRYEGRTWFASRDDCVAAYGAWSADEQWQAESRLGFCLDCCCSLCDVEPPWIMPPPSDGGT